MSHFKSGRGQKRVKLSGVERCTDVTCFVFFVGWLTQIEYNSALQLCHWFDKWNAICNLSNVRRN